MLWNIVISVCLVLLVMLNKQDTLAYNDGLSSIIGSTATLSCTLPGSGGILVQFSWHKGKALIPDQTIAFWDINGIEYSDEFNDSSRYQMTITEAEAKSDFILFTVDLNDEDTYWCSASHVGGDGRPTNNITLEVTVPPPSTTLSHISTDYQNGATVDVISGVPTTFSCTSKGSKPGADITWSVGGSTVDPSPPTDLTENDNDDRLWDSSSEYIYSARPSHHGNQLTCSASNKALPSGISAYIVLDVNIPPEVAHINLYDSDPYNEVQGTVLEKAEHTFHCDVQNTRPSVDITWKKGNTFLMGGTTRVEQNGDLSNTYGTIKLTPTKDDHKVQLTCMADIGIEGSTPVSVFLTLDVYGPPSNITLSGPRDLIENEPSDDLTCTAADAFADSGSISWYNGNSPIESGEGSNNLNDNYRYDIQDTLMLTPQRSDNQNTIRCEARHGTLIGPDYPAAEIKVNVNFCSENISISECVDVQVGHTATLQCVSISSNPVTILEWQSDGTRLPNTHDQTNTSSTNNGYSSERQYTTRIITREDYGSANFKCCGINNKAKCGEFCSNACTLNVLYPPENIYISKTPDVPLEEGGSATLECHANGNPAPDTFKWYKDSSDRDIGDGSNSLIITSATKDNAGFYVCKAGNGIPNDGESDSFGLPVLYSPIIDKSDNLRGVSQGDNVTIDCVANGLPNPILSWSDSHGNLITNGTQGMSIFETILNEDGVGGTVIRYRLLIYNIDENDYGTYTCSATNSIGTPDTFDVHVNGTTVPYPVDQISISRVFSDSLIVVWSPGYSGGEQLNQWFILDHREVQNNQHWEGERVVRESEYQLMGLKEDTLYEVKVFSANDLGRNWKSESVTNRTGYIPASPVSANIVENSVRSLTVEWVPGIKGRETEWFLVDSRVYPDGNFTNNPKQPPDGETRDTVNGLLPNMDYEIVIYNVNRFGKNEEGTRTMGKTEAYDNGSSAQQRLIIILGLVFGSIMVVIIFVLLLYIFRIGCFKPKSKEEEARLQMHDRQSGSADTPQIGIASDTPGGPPVYAEVKKKKKPEDKKKNKGSEEKNDAVLYAKVDKKNKNTKSTNGSGASEDCSAYDNVNFQDKEIESAYDDVANVQSNSPEQPKDDGKTVTAEGLIYQEVGHFKSHPKDAPPIQTEASTLYADLDFSRMSAKQN